MRIALFNQKGGVGKTTCTLNLAAALTRSGTPPLLIDLDPQGHLTHIHTRSPIAAEHSLFAFFQSGTALADLSKEWQDIGNLVPAHQQLIKVDAIFGKGPTALNKLRQGLVQHDQAAYLTLDGQHSGRHTLIDCCPYIGVLSLNAIFAADRIIIPVSTDYLSLQAATQITRTLQVLEPVLKRRIERRYLLTRFDRRRKMSEEIYQRLRQSYGDELLDVAISENVAIAESPAYQKDVFSHNPHSPGARDYRNLLEELQQRGDL